MAKKDKKRKHVRGEAEQMGDAVQREAAMAPAFGMQSAGLEMPSVFGVPPASAPEPAPTPSPEPAPAQEADAPIRIDFSGASDEPIRLDFSVSSEEPVRLDFSSPALAENGADAPAAVEPFQADRFEPEPTVQNQVVSGLSLPELGLGAQQSQPQPEPSFQMQQQFRQQPQPDQRVQQQPQQLLQFELQPQQQLQPQPQPQLQPRPRPQPQPQPQLQPVASPQSQPQQQLQPESVAVSQAQPEGLTDEERAADLAQVANKPRPDEVAAAKAGLERIIANVETVVIGKREPVSLVVLALIARGHVLLEDLPGTGKTTLVSALARSIACDFSRIQFTPRHHAFRCFRLLDL